MYVIASICDQDRSTMLINRFADYSCYTEIAVHKMHSHITPPESFVT